MTYEAGVNISQI